jgi:hypothetical protein
MYDMLPAIEFFESLTGEEFTSKDTDKGNRQFDLLYKSISIMLTAQPEEFKENSCKKIEIGSEEVIEVIKKYKIVCQGESNG